MVQYRNLKRASEYIRLMFLLPENEMLEVIQHPEYSVSKIKLFFLNVLEEIQNKKRT